MIATVSSKVKKRAAEWYAFLPENGYELVVTNALGCKSEVAKVTVKISPLLDPPNTFTPNDDGTNDTFQPKGVGILKFNMQIYDRWGHQVFTTSDINTTWNGSRKGDDSAVKEDTYTWKAQVTDVFNKNHFLVGHVTILR